ncbi:hypothetical protein BST83_18975 [Polaribacter filamentus]|uniref:PAS domain-containing protein n=1 Tax=Polaribacter filamentus TaxID=53483 RepID=A0A2S7KLA4_9FLAO|nr:PAS domain S-box protein [Polaribacter filamentus]PQB03370.1 hypothetical protein BST83_18975 [Polaribacter filamentus]
MSDLQDIDLFKSIFQSSLEGIIVVDLDGIIIKSNSASEKLFGYKAGKLLNQKVECLIPNKFKKNYESHREKYKVKPIELHLGQDLELWGLKKGGSKFPLEINLNPTKIEGKLFVIAFVTDTTSQKKTAKN